MSYSLVDEPSAECAVCGSQAARLQECHMEEPTINQLQRCRTDTSRVHVQILELNIHQQSQTSTDALQLPTGIFLVSLHVRGLGDMALATPGSEVDVLCGPAKSDSNRFDSRQRCGVWFSKRRFNDVSRHFVSRFFFLR